MSCVEISLQAQTFLSLTSARLLNSAGSQDTNSIKTMDKINIFYIQRDLGSDIRYLGPGGSVGGAQTLIRFHYFV